MIRVYAIVEGKTEELFVKKLLAPYLLCKNIYIFAIQITKPGQKGGDVTFKRLSSDVDKKLKEDYGCYVTTFVDFYGLKKWPNLEKCNGKTPKEISDILIESAKNNIENNRFIPFIALHEFEALLFSDPKVLSEHLLIREIDVLEAINSCGEPEAINNSRETAPSKRLEMWCEGRKDKPNFKKTSDGIQIAEKIGIDKIRAECPIFNEWLSKLERLEAIVRK